MSALREEHEMEYTPGPWTNKASVSRLTVTTGNPTYQPICFCFDTQPEAEANARLIAATPELLEFCYEIALGPYKDSNLESLMETYQVRAKILIAKAENK